VTVQAELVPAATERASADLESVWGFEPSWRHVQRYRAIRLHAWLDKWQRVGTVTRPVEGWEALCSS
jgi:hypothetical protein